MEKGFLLVLAAMAIAGNAAAGEKVARPSIVDKITEMDIQMAIIQKEMEYQNLLDKREGKDAGGASLPKIYEVFPVGDSMGAKLIFSDGSSRTVRENQELDPKTVVTSISTAGVTVKRDKKKFILSFVVNAPQTGATAMGALGNLANPHAQGMNQMVVPGMQMGGAMGGISPSPMGSPGGMGNVALPPMPTGIR